MSKPSEPRETSPRETSVKDCYSSSENCCCNADRMCDSCSVQSEIREITATKNFPMFQHRNQEINQTIDSQENHNCDKDFHASEKCVDIKTNEQFLPVEYTPSTQNGENEENKSTNTIFSKDCSTSDESTEIASYENCEHSNILDSRRTRRNSKRKRDENSCPVCGLTVRQSELASHYAKEVENLSKIPKCRKKIRSEEHEGVNTTFVQVKSNRENRHAAKVAKFTKHKFPTDEFFCPACNVKLGIAKFGPILIEEEEHEEVNIMDFDEDSFEEYEFADQTRVRAISMVPGGYRSLHGGSSKPNCDNHDEDLNVDVDDTLAYGSPHVSNDLNFSGYSELDVIHKPSDDNDNEELEQLRNAVLFDPNAERHSQNTIQLKKWGNNGDGPANCDNSNSTLDKNTSEANENPEPSEQKSEDTKDLQSCENKPDNHVASLKEKIRDLEEQNNSVKCLICLEPYTKPVVSTTCWHVHCEECWLMTMGVKKLCPQCNIIVFPSDLRRIYL